MLQCQYIIYYVSRIYEFIADICFWEDSMLVNSGFTFINKKGIYKIENNHIFALYEYGMIPIFSTLEKPLAENLIFEFANIKTDAELTSFICKYGLATRSGIVENVDNDYLFMDISKQEFVQVRPENTANNYIDSTEQYYKHILRARKLLELMNAINEFSLDKMLDCVIFFAYSHHHRGSFHSGEINRFIYEFNKFMTEGIVDPVTGKGIKCYYAYDSIQEPIDDFIAAIEDELFDYYFDEKSLFDSHSYYYFPDAQHREWQAIIEITKWLSDNYPVKTISDIGEVEYSNSRPTIESITEINDLLKKLATAIVLDVINGEICRIRPMLRNESERYVADWQLSTLYEAMYFELLLAISQDMVIKKCPSCHSFFEIQKTNTRRIFCDKICSDRMAQRRSRERRKRESGKPLSS